ncbi:MAG: hypothetical protein AABO58_00950 [Acidobacteriota bacterium]
MEDIDRHVQAAINRSGIKRKEYQQRLRRIVRAADLLLSGRTVVALLDPITGVTQAEFYSALWMLLVADLFRDSAEGSGVVGPFLKFTAEDWQRLDGVFRLLHERYFGFRALPVSQPWDEA